MRTEPVPSRESLLSIAWARAAGRIAALALTILPCAACAAPVQNGGVEVMSGASDRLGLLCRWRRGDDARKDLCAPSDQRAQPSRVRRIATAADKLGGPLTLGKEGDYLLENSEIVVVIDQIVPPERATPLALGGGTLIDAADARSRWDELGQVTARFGERRYPRYERLVTGVDPDGTAWIEVTGHAVEEPQLKVATRYSLGPVDRAVLITTALENRSPSPIGLLELGDIVAWGAAELMSQGKAAGAQGEIKSPYVAGVGRAAAYLIAPVKDAEVSSRTSENRTDLVIERDVALPPNGRAQYERVFAVAPRGDPVAVATEFFYMQGGAPGGLAVKLVDARGAVVTPSPEGRLFLDRAGSSDAAPWIEGWWIRASIPPDDASTLGGEVPPGRYKLRFEGGGRREQKAVVVEIKQGALTPLALDVSDAVAPSAPAEAPPAPPSSP